jgi:hypothetical protein
MKRREKAPGGGIMPRELTAFLDSPEYEGRDVGERYGSWWLRREQWKDAHEMWMLPDDQAIIDAWPDALFYIEDI